MSKPSLTVLPDAMLKLMSSEDRAKLGAAGVTYAEAEAKAEAGQERKLQGQISNYLLLHGLWADVDSMRAKRKGTLGTPDFLCAYHGVPVGIEAKTVAGKVSEIQAKCHEHMKRNGWVVIVATSVDDVRNLFWNLDAARELREKGGL